MTYKKCRLSVLNMHRFGEVVEEFQTNKKYKYGSGGVKCIPGELLKKYLFIDLFYKKILGRSGLHFRANFYMAKL